MIKNMYEKIFNIIIKIFGIKAEVIELYRPIGAEFWAYSETKDMVYQIYVSKYNKNKNGSFGFWVHDENLFNAYKKALKKIMPFLKRSYVVKLKKCLKVK